MERPKVFVARVIPEEGLALIRESCDADIWPAQMPPTRAELLERVRGAAGILSLLTDTIDAEVMDAAGPQLRVISNLAVGVDNIDLAEATRRRIPVGHTPGVLTETTADLAFALMLAAARRIVEGVRYVQAGLWKTWEPMLLLGQDAAGATLGIIGFGRIGKAVARRAGGFHMRILYYDPYCREDPAAQELGAQCVDLETLLRESDFISIHVPLTPQTRHMIDERAFALMKPTAVLVNTARGPIVDPEALYRALRERRIFAAALDVTEPEPLPADSPLLQLDNLIVVPHIGSASVVTRGKMARMAAENLLAGLRGERLPYCANPEVYTAGPPA